MQENPSVHPEHKWKYAAGVVYLPFILSRLWAMVWVYAGHAGRPFLSPVPGGWEGVGNWWLNPWTTYDSVHYLSIAAIGYQPHTAPFFPLYPLLLRLAGSNQILMAAWGVLLSNVCFAIALAVFYRLTKLDYNEEIARRAVWLLAFFPVTVYFSAVYTESLFLLLIVSTFYCMRRDHWALAALFACLAGLTRNSGAVIFLALAFECYRRLRGTPRPPTATRNWALIATLLPLLSLAGVLLYSINQFGGLTAISSQDLYFRKISWPWVPFLGDLSDILTGRALELTTLLNFGAAAGLLALAAVHWKRQPYSYSILMLGIILMHLSYARYTPPYTLHSIRYAMTTFPFVQLLAAHIHLPPGNRLRHIILWGIYLILCAIMSLLFGQKAYIS